MRIAAWLLPLVKPPCRVHQGTIAVRRRPDRPSSVVPDVLVTCEPRERGRSYVSSPNLVVEVISPASATNDMYRKPRVYDAVESLSEYLVVDSRSMWVRLFRRDDDGRLSPDGEDLASPQSRVSLETVALSFKRNRTSRSNSRRLTDGSDASGVRQTRRGNADRA